MSRPTKSEIALVIGDMGRLQGAVKSEAESFVGVNSSGTPCVSIRETTANDLLQSLDRWRTILGALVDDDTPVEVG